MCPLNFITPLGTFIMIKINDCLFFSSMTEASVPPKSSTTILIPSSVPEYSFLSWASRIAQSSFKRSSSSGDMHRFTEHSLAIALSILPPVRELIP